MTEPQPPGTLSDAVARNLQDARRSRGISAAQLADACAKAGFPQLTPSVIANIETGRRDQQGRRRRMVTVDEVYAFSQALGVGVTRLLPAPPGRDPKRWGLVDQLEEIRAAEERWHRERMAELAQQEQAILLDLRESGLSGDQIQVLRKTLGQISDREGPARSEKAIDEKYERLGPELEAAARKLFIEWGILQPDQPGREPPT